MKDAYTAKEIAQALGITKQAVMTRGNKEKWPLKQGKGRGGARKLFPFASLPPDVRRAVEAWEVGRTAAECRALAAEELKQVQGSKFKVQGGEGQGGLPTPVRPYRGKTPAHSTAVTPWGLPEWKEKIALARADLLAQYLAAAHKIPPGPPLEKGGGMVANKQAFLAAHNHGAAGPLPQIYDILGPVTYQTAERWAVTLKRTGDPLDLAPRHGDHLRGTRRMGGVQGDLKGLMRTPQGKILLAWALSPNRYNKAQAIGNARDAMRRRGIPDHESDATYKRFLDDFEARQNHIWVYSREGKQAWNDQCAFYIERDYDLLEVGDCLVADGHTFNLESINPYTGKPKRLTLITFMDMKSNFPVGWEIMPTENTLAIAAALRRAILGLGKLPLCLYLDNGRAFGAKHFTGDLAQSGVSGLFKRLGIETIFAWPYHGQSKTVERWHLTLKEFEKHAPTYVGGGIDEKPPRLHRGEKDHRRMWEKMTRGATPTLMQTHRGLAQWLDEEYNPRPQPRGHLQGKSPLEVFMAGRGPGVDREELRHLMLSQTVRTIHRRGITHLGRDYYAAELYGRRHPVLIRYDLLDPDAIEVFEEDGAYLCEARVMTKVHPIARITGTAAHQEELKSQIHLKKSQENVASSFCRMITETLVQPETEAHFARLGLSPNGAAPKQLEGPQAGKPAPLTDAEKRQIEADAAATSRKMQAEQDRIEEMKARPDSRRYLGLLAVMARGGEAPQEDRMFMYYFRTGEEYAALKGWFEAQDLEMVCQAGAGN